MRSGQFSSAQRDQLRREPALQVPLSSTTLNRRTQLNPGIVIRLGSRPGHGMIVADPAGGPTAIRNGPIDQPGIQTRMIEPPSGRAEAHTDPAAIEVRAENGSLSIASSATKRVKHMGKWSTWALAIAILASAPAAAVAVGTERPFVWMRASDALTLDPHAVNEGTTHALNHHIYEPLIVRDHTGQLVPALAVGWRQANDPLIWHFDLRRNVTFHDGTPLTAADVVFSLERARAPTSDLASRLKAIATITALAPDRVQITTRVRDPLLPIQLTDIFIMSQAWATAHGAEKPLDYIAGEQGYAATHANGTGPYRRPNANPER